MKNSSEKANYFSNTLAKLRHKKWELYVVSRVIHRLNDSEIEFVCQQLILLQGGGWVFADMFFPQFNICLEINERGGHSKLEDRLHDERRQLEILKSVGARFEKIENFVDENGVISDANLDRINNQIEIFINLLKHEKKEAIRNDSFNSWDLKNQYDPAFHIRKGYLDASENPSFRYIRDVLRCFGYTKGLYQQAAWRHPKWTNSTVWLPSFIPHNTWENKILEDEETITEILKDKAKLKKHKDQLKYKTRYTFAKTRSPFGETLYRFLGEFEFSSQSIENDILERRYVLLRRRIDIPNPTLIT